MIIITTMTIRNLWVFDHPLRTTPDVVGFSLSLSLSFSFSRFCYSFWQPCPCPPPLQMDGRILLFVFFSLFLLALHGGLIQCTPTPSALTHHNNQFGRPLVAPPIQSTANKKWNVTAARRVASPLFLFWATRLLKKSKSTRVKTRFDVIELSCRGCNSVWHAFTGFPCCWLVVDRRPIQWGLTRHSPRKPSNN